MLNKTSPSAMSPGSDKEERRLNALYLAVINNPHAPAEEQMEEADAYYAYLLAGRDNVKY